MSNLAINDAGDVIAFDGKAWKPAPMAENDAGQRVVFDGAAWQPIDKLVGQNKGSKAQGESDALASAVGRGVTFGTGDELGATVRAAAPGFSNWMMGKSAFEQSLAPNQNPPAQTVSNAPTYDQRYEEELARMRAQATADKAAHPTLTTAGELGGNVLGTAALTMAPGVGALLRGGGASGLVGNTVKMGIGGGVLGAAQGFAEGEGGAGNRAMNAIIPGAVGVLAGGAVPVLGMAAARAMETAPGRYVSEKVISPLARKIAGMVGEGAPVAKSLSAAAPDGSPGIMGPVGDFADRAGNVAETGAVRRLATALQRADLTPDQVRLRGERLGPEYVLADVDPNLLSAARAAHTMPGQTKSTAKAVLEGRDRQAGNRLTAAFEGSEPPPSAFALRGEGQAFDQNLRSVGAKVYGEMDAAGLKQTPELMALYENPKVAAAIDRIMADEKATRIGTNRAPSSPVEIMHKVKQAIWDLGFDKDTARPGPSASWYRDLGTQYVDALKRANPKLAEADKLYAQAASLPEYFDAGANLLARDGASTAAIEKSAPALADMLKGANVQQTAAARAGATNAARSQAQESTRLARALAQRIDESAPVQSKLGQIYGQEGAGRITKQAAAERQFAETSNEILRGSKTADKIAEIVGDVATPQAGSLGSRALDKLVSVVSRMTAANMPVRDAIGRMTLNMNPSEKERFLRMISAELSRRQQGSPIAASLAGSSGSMISPER
jgi:hypothetical protein